jgi:hypothetical protein
VKPAKKRLEAGGFTHSTMVGHRPRTVLERLIANDWNALVLGNPELWNLESRRGLAALGLGAINEQVADGRRAQAVSTREDLLRDSCDSVWYRRLRVACSHPTESLELWSRA